MVAPICGARPIHSLTGPAIAVAAAPSAPMAKPTMTSAVIHGDTPRRQAARTSGAKVKATTAAASTGIRMGLPI